MIGKIKMIACDMDGTLLNKEGFITEKAKEYISTLKEKGILFTIASGRMPFRVEKHISSFIDKADMYYVANNGATIISKGEVIRNLSFSVYKYKEVILKALDEGLEIDFDYDNSYRPLIETERTKKHADHIIGYDRPIGTSDEVWKLEINKMSVCDPKDSGIILPFLDSLRKIGGCSVFPYGVHAAEIAPEGCTKYSGIKYLAKYLGIDTSEILAIGDHTNDVEMLKNAGFSAVVNNSVKEAREVAKYISEYPYSDGVIDSIEYFTNKI